MLTQAPECHFSLIVRNLKKILRVRVSVREWAPTSHQGQMGWLVQPL